MARKWYENKEAKHGIWEVKFSSWKHFHEYVHREMLDHTDYVWRGQRDSAWALQSSLDRTLQYQPKNRHEDIAGQHLERFKLAVRGRRGPAPAPMRDENEWWALAQHNGAVTPLLDWTASPFVALYFSFEDEHAPASKRRAVWALSDDLKDTNSKIVAKHKLKAPPPVLEFIRPMQDENPRLVSQSGLFSRVPYGESVESWVRTNFQGESRVGVLMKFTFPDTDRSACLRTLNRMNINHLSLFPDLYGAGRYCNFALAIDKY